jgi:hypothetical protein
MTSSVGTGIQEQLSAITAEISNIKRNQKKLAAPIVTGIQGRGEKQASFVVPAIVSFTDPPLLLVTR